MIEIKVAMIGWEYPPHIVGGLGKHCFNLSNELTKLGVEVDFFSPQFFDESSYDDGNFHMHKIPGVIKGRLYSHYSTNENVSSYAEKIANELNIIRPDVVHGHDWISVDALKRAKELGYKTVLTLHSLDFMRSGMPTKVSSIEREGCNIADKIITVSNYMKEQISRRYGVDEKKIIVIYNGIENVPYHFSESEIESVREKFGKFVLFLGRLTYQKGPEYLIYAGKLLHGAHIVFAGSGDIDGLKTLSKSLGVNATFLGFVSEREKFLLYKAAAVYVSPSIYEPFGITIGEALKSSAAVVSSRAGITELLEDGHDYLEFKARDSYDLASKIEIVMNDEGFASELGKNGKRKVDELTWEKCARETLKVYKRI